MRRVLSCLVVLAILGPNVLLALGLGPMVTNSALNEPFEADIAITEARPGELENLTVGLADLEQFSRAGLERPFPLSKLRFNVAKSGSKPVIKITSSEPIREPFLNFLMEVNWSSGRLIREYTVLLDPPVYDSNARATKSAPAQGAAPQQVAKAKSPAPVPLSTKPSQAEQGARSSVAPVRPSQPKATAPVSSVQASSAQAPAPSGQHTTVRGDTLWAIAARERPGAVSVQQVMLAMLRANPDAFVDNNINRLKTGQVLKIPTSEEARTLSQADAIAAVGSQNALWEEYRMRVAGTAAKRPIGARSQASQPDKQKDTPQATAATDKTQDNKNQGKDKLELLSPGNAQAKVGDAVSGGDLSEVNEMAADSIANELSLAREMLDARIQENDELRGSLTEAEEIIELLQRQVQLKDEELAALQVQLSGGDEAVTESTPPEQSEASPDAALDVSPEGEEPTDLETEGLVQERIAEPTDSIAPESMDTEMADEEELDMGPLEQEEMLSADGEMMEDAATLPGDVTEEVTAVEPSPLMDTVSSFVPPDILASIPGGAITVLALLGLLGVGLLILLGRLLAGLFQDKEIDDEDEENYMAMEEDAIDDVDGLDDEFLDPERAQTAFSEESLDTAGGTEDLVDVDPLEEVNLHLAYEQFDKAEVLIKKAIADNPTEHSYKLRLLEVYYAANDKIAYEAAAKDLHGATGGEGQLWESAEAMWNEMSPERKLFTAPDTASDSDNLFDVKNSERDIFDVTTGAIAAGAVGVAGAAANLVGKDDADEEQDEVLDLTASEEYSGADDGVFDITGEDDAGVDVADDVGGAIDLTRAEEGASTDDFIDLGGDDEVEESESIESSNLEESLSPEVDAFTSSSLADEDDTDDLLDITAGDDLLDITADISALTDDDTADENIFDITGEFGIDDAGEIQSESSTVDAASLSDEGQEEYGESSLETVSEGTTLGEAEGTGEIDDLFDMTASDASDSEADSIMSSTVAGDDEEMSLVSDFEDDVTGVAANEGDNDGLADDLAALREGSAHSDLTLQDLDIDENENVGVMSLEDTVTEVEKQGIFNELDSGPETEDDLLSGGSEDLDARTVNMPRSMYTDEQTETDEIDTKLNLAKAYIELGDTDGAKAILTEVADDGNSEQKGDARTLLAQID